MTAPLPEQRTTPPQTSDESIDEALRSVAEIEQRPLSEHHDQLVSAHEVLHQALHPEQGPS